MANPDVRKYFYWVLAPSLCTDEDNINYYYDFSQSIEEYKKVFSELGCNWKWQPVTIKNFRKIISFIAATAPAENPFIINLCDGDDVNDVPGVSVIHELEKQGLMYTGSSAYFYDITTSKIPMKKAFDTYGVPNAPWVIIHDALPEVFEKLKPPVLIKPAVSGGSMGVSVDNVVHDYAALKERVEAMALGYRGWNLMVDGLIAEEFIIGNEYTTFMIGNYKHPEKCMVYEPVQRVFHASLPKEEQFLSFDRLWETYEKETAMPNAEFFYTYANVSDIAVKQKLIQLSKDAYVACKGVGYARLDFREDEKTGQIYCLEVNAQCGLSEDEDYTSIGAILRFSKENFTGIIERIIREGLDRKKNTEIISGSYIASK